MFSVDDIMMIKEILVGVNDWRVEEIFLSVRVLG